MKMMRQNHPEAPVEVAINFDKSQQETFYSLYESEFLPWNEAVTWNVRELYDGSKLYIFDVEIYELLKDIIEKVL